MDKIIILSVQTWKLSVINNPPTFQLDKVIKKKLKFQLEFFLILDMLQILIQGWVFSWNTQLLQNALTSDKCECTGEREIPTSLWSSYDCWGGGGLVKQVMEFFQMENKYSQPNHKNFEDIDIKSSEEKKTLITGCCEWFYEVFWILQCRYSWRSSSTAKGNIDISSAKNRGWKSVDFSAIPWKTTRWWSL